MTVSDVAPDEAPDTVRGVRAREVAVPDSLEAAVALLRVAAARGDVVAFRGGGTELGLGYPPERVDLLVRTERLARVVEYAPADLVVEVEAGCTLGDLQRATAPNGQRLALDPPEPERATLGGLVATNAFGPRRARYGTLRDLIVGISLVRPDGQRVRGGGKVVKNVAGFDLPKLAVGSLGTLGLVATVTLRLHPLPEQAAAVAVPDCTPADLRALEQASVAAQLEPSALVAERDGPAYRLHALFEGFEAGVAEQAGRFAALVRQAGRGAHDENPQRASQVDAAARTSGNLRLRFSVPPAFAAHLDAEALAPLVAALGGAAVVAYPSLGHAFVSATASEGAALVEALTTARRCAESVGGNLVVLEAPPELGARFDPYGSLPASFPLMARLKDRFDPDRRFNRSRFLGGL